MKKITKKIMAVLLVISLSASVCFGCFLIPESIKFTKSAIEIIYGETLNLNDYIEIKNKKSGDYTLSASPSGVLQISGNSVKAIDTGTVTVTATLTSGGKATVSVTASYAETTALELFESGALYQNLDKAENVTFTVFLGAGTNPSQVINWYVNNDLKSSAAANTEGKFTLPKNNAAGAYVVKAELASDASIFTEKTVRVYSPYELPCLVYEGRETYESPNETIFFSFQTEQIFDNPEYLFEMFVNGELKESILSYSPVFEFTPESAGIYSFEFKVNGKTIEVSQGKQTLTVCFKGVVTPYGLSLDFDNGYPSVYLKWLNREETFFAISIIQGGATKVIDNVDVSQGFYDIGASINITQNCEIIVTGQNYGEIYLGGGTASYNHAAIDKAGLQYLNKKFLNGNYYMTSDDEVLEIFDYMLIFRPQSVNRGQYVNSECAVYMSYATSNTAQYYINKFKTRLTITGSYRIDASLKNKILTITVDFYSADSPTNYSTEGKVKHEVFIPPVTSQIGYTGDLPVESFKPSSSVVYNSNQLYYTLEKGLKPVFTQESQSVTASELFNDALNALRGITDNDMSEAETVRAIFDFVMFCVSYDDNATKNTAIDYAVLQPAFYPEGVLKTGFAVCDGISKTVSLLCNIMGIKCIRIVGTARSSASGNSGEHAWNKVMIGGQWYIVDATWGIGKSNIDGVYYKLGTHEFFLLSDADVALTHTEMTIEYPKTAPVSYGWYIQNDMYFYHTDTDGVNAQIEALANKIYEGRNNKQYTVLGQNYTAAYATFEFQAAPTILSSFKNDNVNKSFLMSALYRKGLRGFDYWITGNTVIIGVR